MAYKMNSIGTIAALAFYMKKYKLPIGGVLVGLGGLITFIIQNGAPHNWF
jgi:hypothetical protein